LSANGHDSLLQPLQTKPNLQGWTKTQGFVALGLNPKLIGKKPSSVKQVWDFYAFYHLLTPKYL
jgi:hypothetical protein